MTAPTEKPASANPYPHTCGDAPLLPEFRTYDLNEVGLEKTKAIRQAMSMALQVVEAACPTPSRARSIVVTKLQEASMFAVLGVCEDPANQKPEPTK